MSDDIQTPTTNEEIFKYYTQKAGDINRQFGLAAVGLIWMFHVIQVKQGDELMYPLNGNLLFALYFTLLSLSLDLIQYVAGSLIWRSRFIKNPLGKANKCNACVGITVGLIAFKLLFMLIAYMAILYFLISSTAFI